MTRSRDDDPQCLDFSHLSLWEWGWTVEWLGWKRMLWLAFQIDFATQNVGGVFFGLMVCYGRRLKPLCYPGTYTCSEWEERRAGQ